MVTEALVKVFDFNDPVLGQQYGNGHLHVNFPRHEIWTNREGEWERVELTRTEFALLVAFLRHRGLVLSTSHLSELVWPDELPSPEAVRWHINRLRHKLDGELIETVRGFGYRYRPPEVAV